MTLFIAHLLHFEAVWVVNVRFKPSVAIKFPAPEVGKDAFIAYPQWPKMRSPVVLEDNGTTTHIETDFASDSHGELSLIVWCPISVDEQTIHHVLNAEYMHERFNKALERYHASRDYGGSYTMPTLKIT